jgi:hypothetical protein
MGFIVLIVLAPALRVSLGLFLLRESCDEVGVTGSDALRLERLGYFGDELQQSKTGVDVAVALARLLSKRGNVIAGKVEKPLITLDYASYCTSLLVGCTSWFADFPLRYLRSWLRSGELASGGS